MHIWLTWQWNTLPVSPHDSQEGLPLLTPADSSLSDGEVHSRVGQTEPQSRVSDCSFGLALGIHQLDSAHRLPTTANYITKQALTLIHLSLLRALAPLTNWKWNASKLNRAEMQHEQKQTHSPRRVCIIIGDGVVADWVCLRERCEHTRERNRVRTKRLLLGMVKIVFF
jgi:predicted nucleic acid-binding Zn ribbon protein